MDWPVEEKVAAEPNDHRTPNCVDWLKISSKIKRQKTSKKESEIPGAVAIVVGESQPLVVTQLEPALHGLLHSLLALNNISVNPHY